MRYWILCLLSSTIVFFSIGMLLKVGLNTPTDIVHERSVDWIAVNSYTNTAAPSLKERLGWSKRYEHGYHLLPDRAKWWIKAILGSIILLIVFFVFINPKIRKQKP